MPDRSVLVAGGGAAGMAAAISAARHGAEVFLVEQAESLGGTVTHALIHTVGGLYDAAGGWVNEGLPMELADRLEKASPLTRRRKIGRAWTLMTAPEIYQQVVEGWVAEHPGIRLFTASSVVRLEQQAGMVEAVELRQADQRLWLRPSAVIDATGNANLVRLLGEEHVYDDPERSAGGLIFRMRDVEVGAVVFPKSVQWAREIQKAAQRGTLPQECTLAWVDTGVYEDEVYVKLVVPLGQTREAQDAAFAKVLGHRDLLVTFLKTFEPFANAKVVQTGTIGIRDGGRVKGEYCLTGEDVRACRTFVDAACCGSWPIEYWDVDKGVRLEYLPDRGRYDIPFRSFKLPGVSNLWTAGKCLSADRLAHASARVAGTCWAMGEASGRVAASFPG